MTRSQRLSLSTTDRRTALPPSPRKAGVRLMHSGGRVGPGGARNTAAPFAVGDILWFVDADVVVHERRRSGCSRPSFRRDGAAAVFGCYDDRPAATNFLSQYKNLVHRYYHRRDAGDAETFWAGCGAVRKDVFLAAEALMPSAFPSVDRGHRVRLQAPSTRISHRPRAGGAGNSPEGLAPRQPVAHRHLPAGASVVPPDPRP